MSFVLSYNVALVMVGAGLLGIAAGVTGTFMFLRKRALLSMPSATQPCLGLCGGFMIMVALRHGPCVGGAVDRLGYQCRFGAVGGALSKPARD